MADVKKTFVNLTSTDTEKKISSKFEMAQANKILNLPNSKWKLDDDKFEHNGTEIAPKGKK